MMLHYTMSFPVPQNISRKRHTTTLPCSVVTTAPSNVAVSSRQGFLTIITAAALTCCCPPSNKHQPLPTEDKPAASADPLTCPVSADPEPSPRPKPRPDNLDLSRLSIRESGGYKTFLPEIGSLSPPPERAELSGEGGGGEGSSPEGGSRAVLTVDVLEKTTEKRKGSREEVGGSKEKMGERLGGSGQRLGGGSPAGRGRGPEERAGEREEVRIAEMIKNADLSELQELLRSPVESSPDSPPPW